MTPDNALRFMAQIGIERANEFKDSPATQEAILTSVKTAHDSLKAVLNQIAAVKGDAGGPAPD